jgi:hypothetical protein
LFRPGQLAYFQLRDLVEHTERGHVPGVLRIRDGLPIIDPDDPGRVDGVLLDFGRDSIIEAYRRISEMEPDKQYRWVEGRAGRRWANLLVGRSAKKGRVVFGRASSPSSPEGRRDPDRGQRVPR